MKINHKGSSSIASQIFQIKKNVYFVALKILASTSFLCTYEEEEENVQKPAAFKLFIEKRSTTGATIIV